MSKPFRALVFLPFLAACGGGGGDDTLGLPDGPPAYRALAQEALTIADQIGGYAELTSLPTNQNATFDGVMILAPGFEGATTGYTGDVELTANISGGSGSISGWATDFFRGEFDSDGNSVGSGTSVAGTLVLISPNVSATTLFSMAVTGDLAVEGTGVRDATGTMDAGVLTNDGSTIGAVFAAGTGIDFTGAADNYDAILLAN